MIEILRKNYEELKLKALKAFQSENLEESLYYTFLASTFAWFYHFDIWFDEEIEELLEKIGKKLIFIKNIKKKLKEKKDSENILFITTFLTDIGGHTEALKLWVKILAKEIKALYIISTETLFKSKKTEIAIFLKKYAQLKFLSKKEKYINKILELINIILKISPKYIVLFINPNDVIAISAISALKSILKFKVVFFNHADHVFWLGRNIIDILVEFRDYSISVSKIKRNFSKKHLVIPLTTDIYTRNNFKKSNKNFCKENKTISISIGSSWKLISDGYWDYFKVIKEILQQNSNHMRFLIINRPTNFIKNKIKLFSPEIKKRIKFIPGTSDPLPYYKIADFLIETFPVIGGTVRVEAMALGLPIIFIQNKFSGFFSITNALPEKYPFIAKSNEDVINYANLLINNKNLRLDLSKFLQSYFFKKFSIEKISETLKDLFRMKKIKKISENKSFKINFSTNILESTDYLLKFDILTRFLKGL